RLEFLSESRRGSGNRLRALESSFAEVSDFLAQTDVSELRVAARFSVRGSGTRAGSHAPVVDPEVLNLEVPEGIGIGERETDAIDVLDHRMRHRGRDRRRSRGPASLPLKAHGNRTPASCSRAWAPASIPRNRLRNRRTGHRTGCRGRFQRAAAWVG